MIRQKTNHTSVTAFKPFVLPSRSHSALYLLFFDAFIDFGCGLLVRSEEADDISLLRVQDVPVLVSNNQVQLKDPSLKKGRAGLMELDGR